MAKQSKCTLQPIIFWLRVCVASAAEQGTENQTSARPVTFNNPLRIASEVLITISHTLEQQLPSIQVGFCSMPISTRVPASSMTSGADASVDPARVTSTAWVFHDGANFYRNHLLLPLAAVLAASVLLMILHGDFWLADHVFALQGHAWTLKSHLVTENIIHIGGKRLSLVAWLLVFAASIGSCFGSRFTCWRRPLAYLALTTGLASLLVSGLKATSGMDCPWDLLRYGGDRAFIGWFDWRPSTMPVGRCFPAGHSSGGYAWVTLYFFFLATRPRLRWLGLALALAVGTTFGISQQLRGAHFLSHDVWTLAICWLTALAGYLVFFRRRAGTQSAPHVSAVLGVEP